MSGHRLSRVVAAAALLFAGSLLAAAPASAQVYNGGGTATLSISSSIVEQGASLVVSGSNYVGNESITGTVFSAPLSLGTQMSTASGTFSYTFSTATLSLGSHHVVASGSTGDSASVAFTVVAAGQASGVPVSSIDTGRPGAGSGPNAVLVGAGIALVVVALGGGVFMVRRRRES
jgi:hypothetical protein